MGSKLVSVTSSCGNFYKAFLSDGIPTLYADKVKDYDHFDFPVRILNGNVRREFLDGDLHSLDGPAVLNILTDEREYWIEGYKYSKEDFWRRVRWLKEVADLTTCEVSSCSHSLPRDGGYLIIEDGVGPFCSIECLHGMHLKTKPSRCPECVSEIDGTTLWL